MRYFTSDLHLGHRRIVEFCSRPFADSDEMDHALVATWNTTVGEADEVWVLGDLALGDLERSLRLVQQLHGRIVLVPGNHDRPWPGYRQARDAVPGDRHVARDRARAMESRQRYLDNGIDQLLVVDQGERPVETVVGGHTVVVSHFPYLGVEDHVGEQRHEEWWPTDDGSTWLLHGHVHRLFRQRGRMVNVGIDAWGGRLVAETEVARLMADGPEDRDLLPWHRPD